MLWKSETTSINHTTVFFPILMKLSRSSLSLLLSPHFISVESFSAQLETRREFLLCFYPPTTLEIILNTWKTAENEVSSFLFWLFIAFIPLAINPNEPGKVLVCTVLDMIAFPIKNITKRKLSSNCGHGAKSNELLMCSVSVGCYGWEDDADFATAASWTADLFPSALVNM